MAEITVKELLQAGVHFGHQVKKWNPKMKKFIFAERNGIYIIDLQKTESAIRTATAALQDIAATGQPILYVGTKKQAKDVISGEAKRCNQYFINERWLGGMLTNFTTIRKSIKRLKTLEKMAADGTYDVLPRKEVMLLEKERGKLEKVLGGIKDMITLPGALFVVDTKREKIAIAEARKLNIPIIALVDTNADPDEITYPIPSNDDAIRAISLITGAITDSVLEGRKNFQGDSYAAEKDAPDDGAGSDDSNKRRRRSRRRARVDEAIEAAAIHVDPNEAGADSGDEE